MRTVAEDSRPTLGQTGQIFVTYAAARAFIEPGGYQEHEVESARRALTELLISCCASARAAACRHPSASS